MPSPGAHHRIAAPRNQRKGSGVALLIMCGVVLAMASTRSPDASAQGPIPTVQEGKRLLELRRQQMRHARNPWQMQEILYRTMREQRMIGQRIFQERGEVQARASEERAREEASRMLSDRRYPIPAKEVRRERTFRGEQAERRRIGRRETTAVGRMSIYLDELARTRRGFPDDAEAAMALAADRVTRSASHPEAQRTVSVASTIISGTARYDTADTTDYFDYYAAIQLFDAYGYPVDSAYDAISSYGDSWSIYAPQAGTYYLALVAEGYVVLYWDGVKGSERAIDAMPVIADTNGVAGVDFRIPPGATFSGHLTDLAGDPVGDYSGSFAFWEDTGPDWYVTADSPSAYAYVPIDTSGFFQVRGLRPGRYYVQYQGYSYNPVWSGDTPYWFLAEQVTFTDRSAVVSDGDFTITSGMEVVARVVAPDGMTPLSDLKEDYYTAYLTAREKPPSGAPESFNPRQVSGYAYYYTDGYAHFYGLPAGTWYIWASEFSNPLFAPTWWEGETYATPLAAAGGPLRAADMDSGATLTIPANQEGTYADTLKIVMDIAAKITGALLLPDSTGFASASVQAVKEDSDYGLYGTADGNGVFSFPNLTGSGRNSPAGYSLVAWSPGRPYYYNEAGGTWNYASRSILQLAPGDSIALGEWRIPAGGTIYGTVSDSTTGLPVQKQMYLFDENGTILQNTYSNYYTGDYTFRFVQEGTYTVGANGGYLHQGEIDDDNPFSFTGEGTPHAIGVGDSIQVDFELLSLPVLAVDVILDPAVSQFSAYDVDIEVWEDSNRRRTDYAGWQLMYAGPDSIRYHLLGLEPGAYRIRLLPEPQNYDYDAAPSGDGSARVPARPQAVPPYPLYYGSWPAQFYRSDPDPAADGSASWEGADSVALPGVADTVAIWMTVEEAASLRGEVRFAAPDSAVRVPLDSLGVFLALFDADSGDFVSTADFKQNTFSGGFEFDHLLPGTYKLVSLGMWKDQGAWWYAAGGGSSTASSAQAIPVASGAVTVVHHRLRSPGSGSEIAGGVHLLDPDDPSSWSIVMAYTAGGMPAGYAFTGHPDPYIMQEGDFGGYYERPVSGRTAGTDPPGTYRLAGMPDGTYFLRTWSPELYYELYDYYYGYLESPPAGIAPDGPQKDMYMEIPWYVDNLHDIWYSQIEADDLRDYFNASPDIWTADPPGGAQPVEVNGSSVPGIDFYLAILASGDPNGDGAFDIADVVALVNAILQLRRFGDNQTIAADLNGDGEADIADVVAMVNALLSGGAASVPSSNNTIARGDLVALGRLESATGGVAVPLYTRFGGSRAGLQLTLEVPPGTTLSPTGVPTGMTLSSHEEDGLLRVLLYSTTGSTLPPDETRLIDLRLAGGWGGTTDPIRLVDARTATPGGGRTELQMFAMGTGPFGNALRYRLDQNWPNPFNPTTTIAFTLGESQRVRVRVFNVRGQEVRTLLDEDMAPGPHSVVWDGRDASGKPVASGIYLYTLEAGTFRASRKMLLVK